jgi:hypothetical protein
MMPKEAFHRELRACLSREMRVVFFLNAASRTRSQIASEANSGFIKGASKFKVAHYPPVGPLVTSKLAII